MFGLDWIVLPTVNGDGPMEVSLILTIYNGLPELLIRPIASLLSGGSNLKTVADIC